MNLVAIIPRRAEPERSAFTRGLQPSIAGRCTGYAALKVIHPGRRNQITKKMRCTRCKDKLPNAITLIRRQYLINSSDNFFMDQGLADSPLRFEFTGTDAREDAASLTKFLASELPGWTSRIVEEPKSPKRDGTKSPELTVAIITLMVALPSGVKDGLDLADRFKLKEKIDRLISWAKERRARGQRNPFAILPPNNKPVPLDDLRTSDLLNVLTPPSSHRDPPKKP
jgi:hypothetical protein